MNLYIIIRLFSSYLLRKYSGSMYTSYTYPFFVSISFYLLYIYILYYTVL
nr:MAG TPA: hypothetical protein [Caudoviricetes sp.]